MQMLGARMGSKMWVAVAVLATSACTATAKDQGSATHHQPVPAAHPVTPTAAPGTEPFQALVDDAHARFAGVMDGKNADYYAKRGADFQARWAQAITRFTPATLAVRTVMWADATSGYLPPGT